MEIFNFIQQSNIHIALIEIVLIAFMAYLALRTLQGTLGAEVARGALVVFIIIFIGFLFTAKMVKLENVRTILENLVSVSLFALVVIFQPEIRRLLIRLGESALPFSRQRTVNLAKEVTESAFHISKLNQVGALIVIERKSHTGTFIESGVKVDGAISSQLLSTIFTKNSPLHDGAVIISKGRIAAAHCLLPLSENVEVCRGLGTRHRAAVGLSEIADAVVVIISEESGKVSVAMNGRISPQLDHDGLQALLEKECENVSMDALEADAASTPL